MTPRTLLQTIASEQQLPLSAAQLDQFERYSAELIRWNTHTNLTSITEPRAIVIRHFLDSLTLAQAWPSGAPESLADIGAGAGFPGIPLKLLWPELRLLLVESVGKKTEFLAHIVKTLGLTDVEICTGRAETLGQTASYREQFALVTGRAVANLNVLAEYCLPLCQVGGLFVAPKSADGAQEAALAERALQQLGGQYQQTIDVQLPEVDPRTLVVVRKVQPTPTQYPRRVGLPLKRPL
jgi:16S rRNA (guanine527-N7)-methyltransferase